MKCQGTYTRRRLKGKQCRLPATFGSKFCGNHDPKRRLYADGRNVSTIFVAKEETRWHR
jgi:hypothetical protein